MIPLSKSPIGSPSPTITTLFRPYLAHRRRTLHFLLVQASLCEDSLHFFQDRLICAVMLFCERETITAQKFSPVVAVLPSLLRPVFTCKVPTVTINTASRLTMVSIRALPKRKLTRASIKGSERLSRKGCTDDILFRTFGIFGDPHKGSRLIAY
jgi:hypothetical protein